MNPINTQGGMRLSRASFGHHDAPYTWQRAIGRHVYVFKPSGNGLAVWRLDLADDSNGYRLTRVHDLRK